MPFLASLEDAAGLPLWPLWIGVAVLLAAAVRARRATPALLPAAAGAAWLAIVALMAEAGFSGEARYAVPGAAMLAISGAVGLAALARRHAARRRRGASPPSPRPPSPGSTTPAPIRRDQAHQQALASQLADAVRAAGGRDAVLACGRPYVGRLRGPLMAYRMDVEKRVIEPDEPPRAPGIVFRSRLHAGRPRAPRRRARRLRGGRPHAGVAGPRGLHLASLTKPWNSAIRHDRGGIAVADTGATTRAGTAMTRTATAG